MCHTWHIFPCKFSFISKYLHTTHHYNSFLDQRTITKCPQVPTAVDLLVSALFPRSMASSVSQCSTRQVSFFPAAVAHAHDVEDSCCFCLPSCFFFSWKSRLVFFLVTYLSSISSLLYGEEWTLPAFNSRFRLMVLAWPISIFYFPFSLAKVIHWWS